MADPITISFGALGLFVAGVTAVANMASAYSQYRVNHPRKTKTGRVDNYTANHEGYTMTQHQIYQEPAPFYAAYMDMVQPQSQSQPQLQQTYHGHQFSNPGHAAASYPTYQPPPPKSPSFTERHFRASYKAVNRVLGRTSTAPEVSGQVPHHVLRSSSSPTYHTPFDYQDPDRSLQHVHGGCLTLSKEQRSRDTLLDTSIGMHTGRRPGYNREMALAHWYQFQTRSVDVAEGTIAVVNWSERSIAMYVYCKSWQQYFLNYSVSHCDLEALCGFYSRYQVFTGILKDTWLVGCNDNLKVVEDDGYCNVKSSNCWSLLGIEGNIPREGLFVEMKRAALFGLIQCRSKDPTLLNVDMVGDDKVQFVHVDTEYRDLETKGNCWFSVFSFKTYGWAEQRVLVG